MTERLTVDTITSDQLDALYDRLATAEKEADESVAAASRLAVLVGKRSEKAEKAAKGQTLRAKIAEAELRTLRTGLRAIGADPTQIQNLWAQISLRNRQWRDEKQRFEAASRVGAGYMVAAEKAEAERDGAYRERAHLLAWLAVRHEAVLAPAPDVEEPGWQILYLYATAWQMSWHISPRDAELFDHVERVAADHPRAQWDGHTTEQKYAHIRNYVRALHRSALDEPKEG
ncbi:hypothetical protein PV518_48505 [Streptomyces sp. ND04-05B]|uniref:hypothetical protein n=1 Tax=Streptomyces sp. ND04-05B TaxID=3028693 RepID=UPI0029A4E7AE|nr:hypothetical protein [Streptomyces sp. ND04-05B]MDX3069874.1 hypothetical protein [Streptomyces sp. ND04-05B]